MLMCLRGVKGHLSYIQPDLIASEITKYLLPLAAACFLG